MLAEAMAQECQSLSEHKRCGHARFWSTRLRRVGSTRPTSKPSQRPNLKLGSVTCRRLSIEPPRKRENHAASDRWTAAA